MLQEIAVPASIDASHHALVLWFAGVSGLVSAHCPDTRVGVGRASPVLWVSDAMSLAEMGRPSMRSAAMRNPFVVMVRARDARDALWAMEAGLRCAALGAVVGEIYGDPAVLDFTASRRLAMAAERYGTPCTLVRIRAAVRPSAARRRWRIASLGSAPEPHDPSSPGAPRWRLGLDRARDSAPGEWRAEHAADGAMRLAAWREHAQDGVDIGAGTREAGRMPVRATAQALPRHECTHGW